MAPHTIGVATDSNGAKLTSIMWRANRRADLLAKSAVAPGRLPAKIRKQVADMGKLYKHHCARLSVATSRANTHRISTFDEQGVERTRVIRDSTAERPDWKLRRRQAPAAAKEGHSANQGRTCTPVSLPLSNAGAAMEASRSRSSCKRKCVSSQNPIAAKRIQVIETLRQDACDEEQLAQWVSRYDAKPSIGPTADERMAALQARVRCREKEAADWARRADEM